MESEANFWACFLAPVQRHLNDISQLLATAFLTCIALINQSDQSCTSETKLLFDVKNSVARKIKRFVIGALDVGDMVAFRR